MDRNKFRNPTNATERLKTQAWDMVLGIQDDKQRSYVHHWVNKTIAEIEDAIADSHPQREQLAVNELKSLIKRYKA